MLVVAAIIVILAASVAPIYRDKIVKARINSHLVPVLYAYKERLEELIQDNPEGTCLLGNLGNFNSSNSNLVEGVRARYLPATKEHLIQVAAKMLNGEMTRIGVKQDETISRPIIIEVKIKKNGEATEWVCGSESEYSDFVPYYCQQYSSINTAGWGGLYQIELCP